MFTRRNGARRAIFRKPIERISYGGYLKMDLKFPEFIDYIEEICGELRLPTML